MNIKNKDLNLLVLFNVLYQEQNLTVAADKLALSQPALSHKLNKLRKQFDDPLFVRASRGLTPTPKADELAAKVSEIVVQLEQFYFASDDKDFLQRNDVIHIYSTDFMEQYLLPRLLPVIEQQAPNLQIVCHNSRGKLPQKELETGECDIAIAGFYKNLPNTLYQQALCEIEFKVLACKSNSKIKGTLTLEDYLSCPHLITTLTGDLNGIVDKELNDIGKSRRVVAGTSSFIAPSASIANSDFLLTCLEPVAHIAIQNHSELKCYAPPLKIPSIYIQQIWHQRTHQTPLRKWLRKQIKNVLNEPQPTI